MVETLRNVWRVPELRKKVLYTFFMLLIFRLVSVIPVPGLDPSVMQSGFIVVDGLDDLETVDIQVSVPQKYFKVVSASNYSVRIDLSQIKSAGEQYVNLTGTSTNTVMYGTVTNISVPQVKVVVEEYETRTRIPVQLIVTGEAPEGFYASNPICDPDTVDIAGPKSIVERVARCVAEYDMDKLQAAPGTARTSLSFSFQDIDGNELDDTNLTVTTQSVTLQNLVIDQMLYPKTTAQINGENMISGKPAPGYKVTDVRIYPETVEIAASDLSKFLEGSDMVFPTGRVDITGETSGVTKKISLSRPSSVVYMSAYEVTVVVTIEPVDQE